MSLTIGRLRTRASIPRRLTALAAAVDDAARHGFAPALARSQASRAPARGVQRIRQLRIRLQVTPDDVRKEKLAGLWADAFLRALGRAVAAGAVDGASDVVTAESRAHWIARYVLNRLDGFRVDEWAYEEFARFAALPTAEAIATLLEEHPGEAVDVLAIVDEQHRLGGWLAAMSGEQIRRMLGVLDRNTAPSARRLDLDDLQTVIELLIDAAGETSAAWGAGASSLQGASLAEARAVALFIAQRRRGTPRSGLPRSAGRIRDALSMIEWLCGIWRVTAETERARTVTAALAWWRAGPSPSSSVPLPASIADLLPALSAGLPPGAVSGMVIDHEVEQARALIRLLDRVIADIPAMGVETARQLAGRWIGSAAASMFLLVPVVARLAWPSRIARSKSWREHGPRALTYTLAGTALTIASRPLDVGSADPGLLLLAGWTGEPDTGGFRYWLDSASVDDRRDLLVSLLGEDRELPDGAASSWEETFACLSHALIRRFAEDLRGFRRSSDRFVIDRLLSTSGRILIEPERLVVRLGPNPLWIAVHSSGGDTPVDSAPWLANRRVEFELEGL